MEMSPTNGECNGLTIATHLFYSLLARAMHPTLRTDMSPDRSWWIHVLHVKSMVERIFGTHKKWSGEMITGVSVAHPNQGSNWLMLWMPASRCGIYSSNRKDRRYSTNILYRRCQFGGLKSTNHIEDNACSKSSPKQVFRGFQPNFWGIIFYMICKWTLLSTAAIHRYLQCFWPFWPNFLGYFRGTA